MPSVAETTVQRRNRYTAYAKDHVLGLSIPQSLLATADEVIE
jgi:hypothetical protein